LLRLLLRSEFRLLLGDLLLNHALTLLRRHIRHLVSLHHQFLLLLSLFLLLALRPFNLRLDLSRRFLGSFLLFQVPAHLLVLLLLLLSSELTLASLNTLLHGLGSSFSSSLLLHVFTHLLILLFLLFSSELTLTSFNALFHRL